MKRTLLPARFGRRMNHRFSSFGCALLFRACSGGDPAAPADLVIHNAIVWSGEEGVDPAEAIAVRGDHVAAIGSARDLQRWMGPGTRVMDAGGGLVTPGFIDAHVHLIDGGIVLADAVVRVAGAPAATLNLTNAAPPACRLKVRSSPETSVWTASGNLLFWVSAGRMSRKSQLGCM